MSVAHTFNRALAVRLVVLATAFIMREPMAKHVEPSEAVTAILDHFDEVTDRSFKPLADALYAQFDSDTLTADASLVVALWATTELERVTNAAELVKLWHEVEFGERHPAGGLELGEDSPRYAKVRAFIESRFLAKVLPINYCVRGCH